MDGILVARCNFGPCAEEDSILAVNGYTATCGHCGEVVYSDLRVLSEHDFKCEQGVAVWYSRAMEIEMHRCHQPSAEVDMEQLLDLTASA